MSMLACPRCTTLRFRDDAGINDIQLNDVLKYKGIEMATRGYNVYKASPFKAVDEGYSRNIFLYDWSRTT